jgi:hypothetical protein
MTFFQSSKTQNMPTCQFFALGTGFESVFSQKRNRM